MLTVLNSLSPYYPLAPLAVLVMTLLVVMLTITWQRVHFIIGTLTALGLNMALLVLVMQMTGFWQIDVPEGINTHLFVFDRFAWFNGVVILLCALACTSFTYGYFETFEDQIEEMYLLILTATIGAILMTAANHLAALFMSLELLSVPLYGMLSYAFGRRPSLEAGLKYLVLSATASATLLMGMALVFASTGTLSLHEMHQMMMNGGIDSLLMVGIAMMVFAAAFKLSAAPFHQWTPDVYEGAPVPVSTYIATVSKGAVMAVMLRFFIGSGAIYVTSVQSLLMVIASLSILFGNLLALRQTNIKRLLAYSSIAHIGYALVMLVSVQEVASALASMYMAMYALSSIGLFGVVALLSSPYKARGEAVELVHYHGLFWHRPVLTAVMTMMLLSLAGIPLTAGFITKFYTLLSAVQGGQWFLAGMIVLGSAIGLYYYLQVLITLYQRPSQHPILLAKQQGDVTVSSTAISLTAIRNQRGQIDHNDPVSTKHLIFDVPMTWGVQFGGLVLVGVTLIIVYFGVLPSQLIEWSMLIMLR